MMAKRGQQRAWHFAHKPPTSGCADPDRALHETAKALVVQGLTDAQANGTEYRFGFACRVCEESLAWNIARPDTTIAVERSIVEGTRSDIVIDRGTKGPLIVEVVVAHDIEEPTRARYENSGIPVFIIYPEWDTVADLTRSVNAAALINVSAVRCSECQDALDRSLKERSAARTWALSMLSGLQATPPDSAASASPQIRLWKSDKFGREMYSQVRREVHRSAAILRRLGFVQSAGKPWLFRFHLPEGCGVVFANFGSTEEVPLWEDPSALIHWKLHRRSGEGGSGSSGATAPEVPISRCQGAGQFLPPAPRPIAPPAARRRRPSPRLDSKAHDLKGRPSRCSVDVSGQQLRRGAWAGRRARHTPHAGPTDRTTRW